jgi:hypothetical protein
MLQVFYLDVAYDFLIECCICFSGHIHMLQASIQNDHLFQHMLQVFSSGCFVCCSCYTHMLYVISVSPVSDVCCRSASCCNISMRRKRAHAEAVPTGAAVPMCAASEVDMGGPYLHAYQQARGAQLHA